MIEQFGGVERFVCGWAWRLQQAKPGSRAALRSFDTINRMIEQWHEWSEQQKPTIEDMTAEQLESELRRLSAALVREQPESAIEALENTG